MTSPQLRPFHTVPGVADHTRTSVKTVRRWISSGELIAHKLGAQWRISDVDLELFLRTRRGANLTDKGDQ
jgi:excisionase family DNA binding protein